MSWLRKAEIPRLRGPIPKKNEPHVAPKILGVLKYPSQSDPQKGVFLLAGSYPFSLNPKMACRSGGVTGWQAGGRSGPKIDPLGVPELRSRGSICCNHPLDGFINLRSTRVTVKTGEIGEGQSQP